jgi:hypothetical protein
MEKIFKDHYRERDLSDKYTRSFIYTSDLIDVFEENDIDYIIKTTGGIYKYYVESFKVLDPTYMCILTTEEDFKKFLEIIGKGDGY